MTQMSRFQKIEPEVTHSTNMFECQAFYQAIALSVLMFQQSETENKQCSFGLVSVMYLEKKPEAEAQDKMVMSGNEYKIWD